MSLFYDHVVHIGSRDVDGLGRCRPSALLCHLQEAATLAAEAGGFGREVLLERHGAFWMLARLWFRLERPLGWDETLTVRTWHRGGRGAVMYRDFDLYVNGELVGEGVSGWVLADLNSRRLLRLKDVSLLEGTEGGGLCKSITLSKLKMPAGMEPVEVRTMRYSDTDINAHINNTRYADFACDAVGMEACPENRFVSEMQLGYVAECKAGERIQLLAGGEGDERFVQGVDLDGKPRFEVKIVFQECRS